MFRTDEHCLAACYLYRAEISVPSAELGNILASRGGRSSGIADPNVKVELRPGA
jgi:hypothetical protein